MGCYCLFVCVCGEGCRFYFCFVVVKGTYFGSVVIVIVGPVFVLFYLLLLMLWCFLFLFTGWGFF